MSQGAKLVEGRAIIRRQRPSCGKIPLADRRGTHVAFSKPSENAAARVAAEAIRGQRCFWVRLENKRREAGRSFGGASSPRLSAGSCALSPQSRESRRSFLIVFTSRPWINSGGIFTNRRPCQKRFQSR
jgi:hypothetical protein